jgi:hypothetical protein
MGARSKWLVMGVAAALVLIASIAAYTLFDNSITRGLEEEKSYTRHAMEYHRDHPDKRQGDLVLEVWSDADYIAQLVYQQHEGNEWAQWSDALSYLPQNLRRHGGKPYCILNLSDQILVFWALPNQTVACQVSMANSPQISTVQSGDLDFSGRSDFWVYAFRKSTASK